MCAILWLTRRKDELMTIGKWAAILTLAAGVTGGATAASAITFDLTSDHCTGGCGTAPFGTVDVTQVGANVNFVVDLANGPPNAVGWAQTGAADFQLFKFNATGVVVGDISVTQTFAGQTLQADTGAFNGDGTGPFSFGISCTTCGNGNLGITSNLVFSVANATIADLTAGNPTNIFVADVFSGQTGNTGPVDVSVPAPLAGAGLPGLVMACGGLIGLARRRRQRIA
jgi:hypothetical protein